MYNPTKYSNRNISWPIIRLDRSSRLNIKISKPLAD